MGQRSEWTGKRKMSAAYGVGEEPGESARVVNREVVQRRGCGGRLAVTARETAGRTRDVVEEHCTQDSPI